ncbi:MAG TPA: helix-turn-helix transcriptional regulator [Streptosporangiaceae bacterium]|nr:helix-turn-helix transcriptional regulator [Streptosporangiaceae bacterium]
MPGRLEPLRQHEELPGAAPVQAVSPVRPGGQGPARPSRLGRPGCDPQQEIFLARQIRARGLVAGLQPGQIAAKIHDECGPAAGTSWIRAYRLALGISLADVVAQVRAWYVSEGRTVPRFSETLLSAYESGQKRPGPEYLHYLCAVYRADPPDLGYPDPCFCGRGHGGERPARAPAGPGPADPGGPAGHLPATPGHPGAGPGPGLAVAGKLAQLAGGRIAGGPPAGAGAAMSLVLADAGPEDDDDVIRRMLLRLIADPTAAVDGQFFGAVDRIRRRMDDALVGGTVSAIMLDEWEEATVGYGKQYMTVPPLRLLCDVLLDFGDVRRMSERRQSLEFSERLCRLAGRLAGLIGMIMINVGDQRLARSFFRTARTAADETGDRHPRAWVAVREALVPLYYGDPAEASALARAGAGLAGRNPCVAGVMAPVLEARALAWAAARREDASTGPALSRVRTLLAPAHEALSRLPATERGDTAFGYTERQLLFHEGDTLVMLGDHQGAEKAFTWSLDLYAPDEILDRSLIGLGLARCRLEADEPEEALRLGLDTLLAVPREHRSEIMMRSARLLADTVAVRHGEQRAVREYREALLSA